MRPEGDDQVLWWIEAAHVPSVGQGLARLGLLQAEGPSQAAFTVESVFPPPRTAAREMEPEPCCVGWS